MGVEDHLHRGRGDHTQVVECGLGMAAHAWQHWSLCNVCKQPQGKALF